MIAASQGANLGRRLSRPVAGQSPNLYKTLVLIPSIATEMGRLGEEGRESNSTWKKT